MTDNDPDSATAILPLDMAAAIAQLGSARTPEARVSGAGTLVEVARAHCAGVVDVPALTRAADALLVAHEQERQPQRRRQLAGVAHAFIDLSRMNSVRQAACPAEIGLSGGQWLERVVRLIDKTDFTVGEMFRQRSAQYPGRTLFVVPRGELATEYSWEQVTQTTQQIACGVLGLFDEAPVVAIFTPNRIEGAMFDLACLTHGIVNAMVPANSVPSQLAHILTESAARLLVVSGSEQLSMALTALENLPSLEWVVTLDALPGIPGAKVMTLDDLIARGKSVSPGDAEQHAGGGGSNDLATTMYTSGTTGVPKGIKFSQLNLVSKRFARVAALPDIDENEVFLCYLPLYHTFGRYLEMLGAVHLAATYIFAEDASTATLVRHMRRFRPTAMIGVPKKWIDLRRRVVGTDEPPDDPQQVRKALAELTGGRLRWGLSAAGRLDPAVFRFFQYNGIDLLSGYGMTEATGGITMTPPGQYIEGSIGKALPAIELNFDDDNELLLRGPYVTSGYTDPQDNATAFRDGWFCTGDIVNRDAAGYLKHVDRKKDIYKNASGRTIAPQRVEALFADFPEVSMVFAVGDGREYVTLLIQPNMSCPEVDFEGMSEAAVREYFRALVVSCNRFLAPFERVVNFALIDRAFTVERGELTSKGSFRRATVERNFSDVIEPMYASASIERMVGGLRVKIPVAFVQHLGATETGTQADDDGLVFRAVGKKLRIRPDRDMADRVWIGNCCYDATSPVIDLDDWLRLPKLWVGNAELTHVTGESILIWSLSGDDRATPSKMVRVKPPEVETDEWQRRLDTPRDATPSLLTVHAAAVALSGAGREAALRAVDYLAHTISAGGVRYQELAEAQLQHACRHGDQAVRSRAFVALLEHQSAEAFGTTASMFSSALLDFLDDEACQRIAEIGIKPEHWRLLRRAFASLRRSVTHADSVRAERFVIRLLHSLDRIADLQEDYFLPVRRELMAWMLVPVSEAIRVEAAEVVDRLTASFRGRLGRKQEHAGDPRTNCDYNWGDTLRFEDGIDTDELDRISGALQQTELLREAVFLLHRKKRIDLADLAPDSVWISLLGSRFGRSIYHVGVRLRNRERCDFAMYVRGTASAETFLTQLRLMAVAAGEPGMTPLTPQFGGYWPDYGIASAEYIPGESLESLVRHMHEHPDRDVQQRLKNSWKHLCWSALTAAFESYRRTEGRWILAGTVARNVAVPVNDFDENTRIFSAAGWRPFEGTLDMITRLKRAFIDRIRFHFPALAPLTTEEMLFASAIEACGLPEGLAFLQEAIAEGEGVDDPTVETIELCTKMKAYVRKVRETGYMPKMLYFAIARYNAWSSQVPDAGVHARAAQLRQLQNNYRIDAVARKFPGSRLCLYAETVLKDSPEEGRVTIEHAIRRLREGADIKEVLGRLYTDLREKLPTHNQQYFLTRAAYPHLELNEKAELVATAEIGPERAELVTLHTDRMGRELRIRPVANSRELDILHRIFYTGGIGGGLSAHERFLVVADQAGYVVGGAGYIHRTPNHVLLEQIAVLPRCRGRGIGRLLVHEFLRRQTAESIKIVSAEFIRNSWLAQFGFKSHPRHAGVVLHLATA